jgi:carbamoyltransferase
MATVLGLNAVFHDPAAALVVDGQVVAAAEEERFSRRKHGKDPVPFSTWELPTEAATWCLRAGGVDASELDVVTYSYEPRLVPEAGGPGFDEGWEHLRTTFAARAPGFLASALPRLDPSRVEFVPHHVAHAASAHLAAPYRDSAVLVLDGRGEAASHLSGHSRGGELEILAAQPLPDSLGLLYEEVTAHLGFRRSSDEYKVMALASYGDPDRFASAFRRHVVATEDGGFRTRDLHAEEFTAPRPPESPLRPEHADLAAGLQRRLEEVVLALGHWLHDHTRERAITMAGGVALNCVANARLAREGPFDQVWVQPAAGDAGTALGGALHAAHRSGDRCLPMGSAALGREWSEDAIEDTLLDAAIPYERPTRLAEVVAEMLAANAVVGWFQGRSEYGPRALGHRSLLVDPSRVDNLQRMNAIKGREEFRPVAPIVLLDRAAEIFDGVIPSPYMLFVHTVRPEWRERIAAAVHVDGTARAQTVDRREEPLLAALLDAFARRTGTPVLVNTSFNTAGRPMVDSPKDALECFGSGPIGALVLGPFLVRRSGLTAATAA